MSIYDGVFNSSNLEYFWKSISQTTSLGLYVIVHCLVHFYLSDRVPEKPY